MKRDEVLERLTTYQQEIAQFGIKSLALFGSVVRDEAKPESDVDILVEFQGPETFDQYMELPLKLLSGFTGGSFWMHCFEE